MASGDRVHGFCRVSAGTTGTGPDPPTRPIRRRGPQRALLKRYGFRPARRDSRPQWLSARNEHGHMGSLRSIPRLEGRQDRKVRRRGYLRGNRTRRHLSPNSCEGKRSCRRSRCTRCALRRRQGTSGRERTRAGGSTQHCARTSSRESSILGNRNHWCR